MIHPRKVNLTSYCQTLAFYLAFVGELNKVSCGLKLHHFEPRSIPVNMFCSGVILSEEHFTGCLQRCMTAESERDCTGFMFDNDAGTCRCGRTMCYDTASTNSTSIDVMVNVKCDGLQPGTEIVCLYVMDCIA